MNITQENLILILNTYLREYALSRSIDPHPIFKEVRGGLALSNRLYKILRDKQLEHLVVGNSINFLEFLNYLTEFFKQNKPIYLIGLNHWFSQKDVDTLHSIYLRKILSLTE